MIRNLLYVLMWTMIGISGFAASIDSFSASLVNVNSAGDVRLLQKIFVTPDKIKVEMQEPAPGIESPLHLIYLKEKKVVVTLVPEKKVFLEKPMKGTEMDQIFRRFSASDVHVDLGTEEIQGFSCKKQRVEKLNKVGNREIITSATIWVCNEFDFPIRIQSERGPITEYRDISLNPPPESLFQTPTDFKKIDQLSELMKPTPSPSSGKTPAKKMPIPRPEPTQR